MPITAFPGDTVRGQVSNLTHIDSGAVTASMEGTLELLDWDSHANVDGPFDITLNESNNWYYDFTAPAEGHYRLEFVMQADGAQRTFYDELTVTDPTN